MALLDYGDADRFGAWVWLILGAAWKPTPFDIAGKTVTLERGQICVSIRQLGDEWGWSKSKVDRFLTRLETETMIERKAGQGRCIITICNYEKYQEQRDTDRDSSGTPTGTAAGQQRDIKEQGNKLTIDSPLTPQGGRRGKSKIPKDWKAPQVDELTPQAHACAKQWPQGKYAMHAEAFHNFWLGDGRMKSDWERTWANRVVAIHDQVMRSASFGTGPPGRGNSPSFLDHKLAERANQS